MTEATPLNPGALAWRVELEARLTAMTDVAVSVIRPGYCYGGPAG